MKALLSSFFFLITSILSAQFAAKTESVILYKFQTVIKHKVKVQLKKGNQDVVISNIAQNPHQPYNISFNKSTDWQLNNYEYETYYASKNEKDEDRKELEADLEYLKKQQNHLQSQKELIEQEISLFTGISKAKNPNLSLEDMLELGDLYQLRLLPKKDKVDSINSKLTELQSDIASLNSQLKQFGQYQKHPQVIMANITASRAGEFELEFSYTLGTSLWTPEYEIESFDGNPDLTVSLNIKLNQNTGFDWVGSELFVSTASEAPKKLPNLNKIELVYGSAQPTTMRLKSVQAEANVEEDAEMNSFSNIEKNESENNLFFKFKEVVNIKTGSKNQILSLEKNKVPADKYLLAIPQKSIFPHLMAKIELSNSIFPMGGMAKIWSNNFLSNEYYIQDPKYLNDENFAIDMGADQSINIQRIATKESKSNSKILGNKEENEFKISVSASKSKNIALKIQENFPVSLEEDIKVSLNASGAEIDYEKGLATWNLTLPSDGNKIITWGYDIKYDNGKYIQRRYR